jgi:hypothetical protein
MNTIPSGEQTRRNFGRASTVVILLLAVGVLAALVLLRRPGEEAVAHPDGRSSAAEPAVSSRPAATPVVQAPEPDLGVATVVGEAPPAPAQPALVPAPAVAPAPKTPNQKDPPPQDQLARIALSLVGFDPDAEAYWYAAINDPDLSAHERQDLIEDLNEDGFADPRRPAPEELPLILSRLALIEQVAGNALDKVNDDAFAEAYKDLVNMRDRLLAR